MSQQVVNKIADGLIGDKKIERLSMKQLKEYLTPIVFHCFPKTPTKREVDYYTDRVIEVYLSLV